MGSIGGMSLLVALLPLLFLLQTEAQNACSNTCSVNDLEMHAGHCIQKFPRCPKRRLGCIENMLPGCGGQCFCMKAGGGNPFGGGNLPGSGNPSGNIAEVCQTSCTGRP